MFLFFDFFISANAAHCSFYDGSVGVYDMRSKSEQPLYLSTPKTGKHTDPVWQVRRNANINFLHLSFLLSVNVIRFMNVHEIFVGVVASR